jgi:UDP-N-acetylglucosamine kinase
VIPEQFRITSATHEVVFGRIKEKVFLQARPVFAPVALIIGAQPGSGKTNLIKASLEEFDNNCVVVNGDDYRDRHPHFREIACCDDKKIAEYTETDVRDWTSRLLSHSINNSYNTILELTLRLPGPISATLEKLGGLGYSSHLKILAVKKEFSTLGVHERYEFQKEGNGFGRWTAQESHEASYVSMPQTIEILEKLPFLSSVSIFDRDNAVLYENNRLPGGNWKLPAGGASRAIQMFREAPLSAEQKVDLEKSWEDLLHKKMNRKAPAEEIEMVRVVLKSLPKPKAEVSSSFRPGMR